MKWNDISSILVKLSSQTNVPKLNAVGIQALRQLLGSSSYRIFVNHSLKHGESLNPVYLHSKYELGEDESKLISKLGDSSWGYEHYFETKDCYCFMVSSQNHCFVLATVYKDENCIDSKVAEIIATVVQVWGSILDTLYFYQRDYLTGLFNRNILMDAINGNAFDTSLFDDADLKPISPERRAGSVMPETHAVALIDIDEFKQINETWGHSIGDEVLIKLAQLMEISFRDCDVICRYGGEEFAVYMRFVTKSKAEEILQRFCVRVSESNFPKVEHVTVTIGYAMAFPGILASELLERADKALFLGKEKGKNQVNAAEDHHQLWSDTTIHIGEIDLFDD